MEILGRELAEWTGGYWINGQPDCVGELVFDSRLILPDSHSVFVAMTHGQGDGHNFVESAVSSGAIACIVERKVEIDCPQSVVPDSLKALGRIGQSVRDRYAGSVIAVTGSCGKTSTKELLKAALGAEQTYAKAGNWNNKMGVPLTLYGLRDSASKFAIIEAGISERGEMSELSAMIQPDFCVITSIGEAHLSGLESLNGVAEEKAKVLESARSQALLIAPKSVLKLSPFQAYGNRSICVSDVETVLEPMEGVFTYTFESIAPFQSKVCVEFSKQSRVFNLHTSSTGMIQNAVLAMATAHQLGVDLNVVVKGLESWRPDPNRGAISKIGDTLFYQDAYNANPSSMMDALDSFRRGANTFTQKLYVLGVMDELGMDAESLHRGITKRLLPEEGSELIFIGSESLTAAYREGAQSAGWEKEALHCYDCAKYVKSMVENFSGAVFLKGSRSCHLESLIPNNI